MERYELDVLVKLGEEAARYLWFHNGELIDGLGYGDLDSYRHGYAKLEEVVALLRKEQARLDRQGRQGERSDGS